MFYYKILLELIFYGVILFGIIHITIDIHKNINLHRRKIRRNLRIIKNWY